VTTPGGVVLVPRERLSNFDFRMEKEESAFSFSSRINKQSFTMSENADEAVLDQRAGGPAVAAMFLEECLDWSVMHMVQIRHGDEHSDIKQVHGSDSFLVHELPNQLGGHAGAAVGKAQHAILATDKGCVLPRGSGLDFTTQGVFHHGFERDPTPGGTGFGLDQQVIGKVKRGFHTGDRLVLREVVKQESAIINQFMARWRGLGG
jgi:hypothetical protein